MRKKGTGYESSPPATPGDAGYGDGPPATTGDTGYLEQRVAHLTAMVERLAQMSAFENIVHCGFEKLDERLAAQLAPLQALTPARDPLDPERAVKLADIRTALTRLDFTFADEPAPAPCLPAYAEEQMS